MIVLAAAVTLYVTTIVGGDSDGAAFASRSQEECQDAVAGARTRLQMKGDKGVVTDCYKVDVPAPKTGV